jgi:hypothetical protein
MAKYTKDDPDIQNLDPDDRVNYEFEMLKYNVDANQEVYIGAQSVNYLRNPNQIAKMFSSPVKFTVGLFALLCYILIVVILIFVAVLLILKMFSGSENKLRASHMQWMALYMFVTLLILIGLYWFLNKIVEETTSVGFMTKPL